MNIDARIIVQEGDLLINVFRRGSIQITGDTHTHYDSAIAEVFHNVALGDKYICTLKSNKTLTELIGNHLIVED